MYVQIVYCTLYTIHSYPLRKYKMKQFKPKVEITHLHTQTANQPPTHNRLMISTNITYDTKIFHLSCTMKLTDWAKILKMVLCFIAGCQLSVEFYIPHHHCRRRMRYCCCCCLTPGFTSLCVFIRSVVVLFLCQILRLQTQSVQSSEASLKHHAIQQRLSFIWR